MVKKEEKALAFTGIESGAVALPDYLKETTDKGGLETGTEMVFGFAKLMQAMSPEVKDAKLFQDGEIINSLSVISYGKEFTFIPLIDQKQAIRWIPRKEGGGMDCISSDLVAGSKHGECAKCEFNYDNWKIADLDAEVKKISCIMYLNFPSLINGEEMPTIIAFEKTKYKVGQKLKALYINRCASIGKSIPIYAMKFKLLSVDSKSPDGTFKNFDVSFAGFSTAEEYQKAKKWSEVLKQKSYKVDLGVEVKEDKKEPF